MTRASFRRLRAVGVGAASGLLLYLAFSPVDLGALAFVALVPLAWEFRFAPPRQFWVASSVFGLTFFSLLVSWSSPYGPAYPVLVLIETVLVILALAVGRVVQHRISDPWKFTAFPMAFLAGEYVRSLVPWGGTVWGGLGYTQHNNLVQMRLVAFTGVWGLTFLVALINSLIVEGLRQIGPNRRTALGYLVGAGLLFLFPSLVPKLSEPNGDRARIAIVQGNVPENGVDPHADDQEVLDSHVDLTERLDVKDLALVIWPEGVIDQDLDKNKNFSETVRGSIISAGVPFLISAQLSSIPPRVGRAKNVNIFYGPDASLRGIYVKQHLVPAGEYIPHRKLLAPLVAAQRRITDDLVPGNESTVFDLPEGKFASVICYESAFPNLVRSFVNNGARLLVFTTNNAAFGRTAMSAQNLAINQLRAAEHRMWVAQAAISGISAVIAPDGKVVERTSLFEKAVLTPTVRFATRQTPYARFGDWLPRSATLLVGVWWAWEAGDVLLKRHSPRFRRPRMREGAPRR